MSDDVPPRVTDDVICAPKCKECQCVSISFYLKNVFFQTEVSGLSQK